MFPWLHKKVKMCLLWCNGSGFWSYHNYLSLHCVYRFGFEVVLWGENFVRYHWHAIYSFYSFTALWMLWFLAFWWCSSSFFSLNVSLAYNIFITKLNDHTFLIYRIAFRGTRLNFACFQQKFESEHFQASLIINISKILDF